MFVFPQICSFLRGATVEWLDKQKVPFALKGRGWVGFDNQTSYYHKVGYLHICLTFLYRIIDLMLLSRNFYFHRCGT